MNGRAFPDWAPPEVVAMWEDHKSRAEKQQAAHEDWYERDAKGFALAKKEAAKGGRVAPPGMRLATLEELKEQELGAAKSAKRSAARLARQLGIRDLLHRLLTDDRMRAVWPALSRAGNYQGDITHSAIFASAAIRAWMGPLEEESWSMAERAKWVLVVTKLSEKLAGKVERTGADDFLPRRYPSSSSPRAGDWAWPQMSELLREFRKWAHLCLAPARLDHPRHPHAERAYFVRIMAECIRESFNGPRAEWIAKTCSVALCDDKITTRQVRRLLEEKRSGDGKRQKKRRNRH